LDDLESALREAIAAATAAGEAVVDLSARGSFEVRSKGGTELVTTADLLSDELIRKHLRDKFPEHRFLSEEVVHEGAFDFSGPVWVIDPIDGTSNYAHGHPYVSISVALVIDGVASIGVVNAPFLGELFAAVRGRGATRNGCPIRVSAVEGLRRALVGTGVPHDRSNLRRSMVRIERLLESCQDIRRAGSPALDICWVAAGQLDGHSESLAPWDVAAAGLIATEAGALRGNLRAGNGMWPADLRGEEFIVAAPGVYREMFELLLLD
jgi:myo-inositol-1(or 4)-monophosphatase